VDPQNFCQFHIVYGVRTSNHSKFQVRDTLGWRTGDDYVGKLAKNIKIPTPPDFLRVFKGGVQKFWKLHNVYGARTSYHSKFGVRVTLG
jgi:hypothetical protein